LATSSRDGTGLEPVSGLLPEAFRVPDGTEAVVYLAASPSYRDAPRTAPHLFAVNVFSAIVAAEHARRAGAKRFVYASTGNVYAPSFAPLCETAEVRRDDWYALSKLQAEEALALFRPRLEVMIARLFGVYGPGQKGRLVPNLATATGEGRPIELLGHPHDPGDQAGLRISLCYVDDAVQILARLALEGGPACLNVAGDEVLSVRSIADALGRRMGKMPRFELRRAARASDLIADIGLLKREFEPRFTPFEQGIERTVAAQA
jgi:nucleoside-diphosphate-sugar epimerase